MYSENIKLSKSGIFFTDKNGNNLTIRQATKKIFSRIFNWFIDFELFLINLVSLHIPIWTIRKFVFILAGVKIDKGTNIHMGCKFFNPSKVQIGYDSKIGDGVFLDGRASLIIGNHVDIASEVMIYNSEHDINSDSFSVREETVIIGDYVFIGPRAIILPGVKLGKGSIVAAGAVVTKNVEEFTIVAGVPAKPIGTRKNQIVSYKLGRARLFQ